MPRRRSILDTSFAATTIATVGRVYRAVMFASMRIDVDPRVVALLRTREPAVFLCWHQDLLFTFGWLSRFNVRRPTAVLTSASRDGGIAAALCSGIGYREIARGSSARRGAAALLHLSRVSRDRSGMSVAIVADGPRPPARLLKPGGLVVARDAGLPIWLLRTSWRPDASLRRTWAKFHVPRPFARGVVCADGPILVPPDLDRDGLERLRGDVERRMNALADAADAKVAALV